MNGALFKFPSLVVANAASRARRFFHESNSITRTAIINPTPKGGFQKFLYH